MSFIENVTDYVMAYRGKIGDRDLNDLIHTWNSGFYEVSDPAWVTPKNHYPGAGFRLEELQNTIIDPLEELNAIREWKKTESSTAQTTQLHPGSDVNGIQDVNENINIYSIGHNSHNHYYFSLQPDMALTTDVMNRYSIYSYAERYEGSLGPFGRGYDDKGWDKINYRYLQHENAPDLNEIYASDSYNDYLYGNYNYKKEDGEYRGPKIREYTDETTRRKSFTTRYKYFDNIENGYFYLPYQSAIYGEGISILPPKNVTFIDRLEDYRENWDGITISTMSDLSGRYMELPDGTVYATPEFFSDRQSGEVERVPNAMPELQKLRTFYFWLPTVFKVPNPQKISTNGIPTAGYETFGWYNITNKTPVTTASEFSKLMNYSKGMAAPVFFGLTLGGLPFTKGNQFKQNSTEEVGKDIIPDAVISDGVWGPYKPQLEVLAHFNNRDKYKYITGIVEILASDNNYKFTQRWLNSEGVLKPLHTSEREEVQCIQRFHRFPDHTIWERKVTAIISPEDEVPHNIAKIYNYSDWVQIIPSFIKHTKDTPLFYDELQTDNFAIRRDNIDTKQLNNESYYVEFEYDLKSFDVRSGMAGVTTNKLKEDYVKFGEYNFLSDMNTFGWKQDQDNYIYNYQRNNNYSAVLDDIHNIKMNDNLWGKTFRYQATPVVLCDIFVGVNEELLNPQVKYNYNTTDEFRFEKSGMDKMNNPREDFSRPVSVGYGNRFLVDKNIKVKRTSYYDEDRDINFKLTRDLEAVLKDGTYKIQVRMGFGNVYDYKNMHLRFKNLYTNEHFYSYIDKRKEARYKEYLGKLNKLLEKNHDLMGYLHHIKDQYDANQNTILATNRRNSLYLGDFILDSTTRNVFRETPNTVHYLFSNTIDNLNKTNGVIPRTYEMPLLDTGRSYPGMTRRTTFRVFTYVNPNYTITPYEGNNTIEKYYYRINNYTYEERKTEEGKDYYINSTALISKNTRPTVYKGKEYDGEISTDALRAIKINSPVSSQDKNTYWKEVNIPTYIDVNEDGNHEKLKPLLIKPKFYQYSNRAPSKLVIPAGFYFDSKDYNIGINAYFRNNGIEIRLGGLRLSYKKGIGKNGNDVLKIEGCIDDKGTLITDIRALNQFSSYAQFTEVVIEL